MMTTAQALITVFICAAVTVLIRAAAFLLFPAGRQAPAFITWLSRQLPRAVMAMLLIYCLKDVSFAAVPNWVPTLAAVAVTAALHLWKRQMMLSIAGGTALYMILIRLIV